jgi:hypothetical protein
MEDKEGRRRNAREQGATIYAATTSQNMVPLSERASERELDARRVCVLRECVN